ncbi:hypothetical protein FDG95_gp437 [Pectobacterium phage vB_PcaM_CBB]|uniref:Uncharacterized protein n=1 Tax=Pectobacterium phage vB_PcaM_CBB TaxID=2772511 RepID=A0A1L2CVQ7_9CAUD|nr:hypothetical protein FDG95_gp437 [Pectobacterium phage vB_PcaM_CBB]AMM44105.1 hypothetical protein CBB_542 [Pectobacterium phage vB_PcaM_CBB]
MIKLCIEDITLNQLEPKLLPFVQWKSLKVSDLEGVSDEIISKYIFQMARPVIKSMIKNKNIDFSHLTDDQWVDLVHEAYNDDYSLFDYFQLPYSALMKLLESDRNVNRYASAMAKTQKNMPVQEALRHASNSFLNHILLTNSNPALMDYMFSEEGIAQLKEKRHSQYLQYLTSEEAKKIGARNIKNRRISPELLRRAGACHNGVSYCSKMLKELNLEQITWDEAIHTIRNNPKLQKRSSLLDYMEWIYQRSSHLPE